MKIICIALLVLLAPPIVFYAGFEIEAYRLTGRYGLPVQARNGVKHAFAAAMMYSMLRHAGMNGSAAEEAVFFLGALNERTEVFVKAGNRDSGSEMRKDLGNNVIGVAVARWQSEHAPDTGLAELIVKLAAQGRLITVSSLPVPEHDSAGLQGVNEALVWLQDNRQRIAEEVAHFLNAQGM